MALNWLMNLVVPEGQFRIPISRRRIPHCHVRLLEDKDFDACEAIYRLNEPSRFPSGYFPRFSEWLRNRLALIIVIELNGEVVGVGGIAAQIQEDRYFAPLSFGMIHPTYHRNGYGTVLLLSRLALLRPHNGKIWALLTTAGGSESYYCRFGFKFVQAIQATEEYLEKHYFVEMNLAHQELCRSYLTRVTQDPKLQEAPIPIFERPLLEEAVTHENA